MHWYWAKNGLFIWNISRHNTVESEYIALQSKDFSCPLPNDFLLEKKWCRLPKVGGYPHPSTSRPTTADLLSTVHYSNPNSSRFPHISCQNTQSEWNKHWTAPNQMVTLVVSKNDYNKNKKRLIMLQKPHLVKLLCSWISYHVLQLASADRSAS